MGDEFFAGLVVGLILGVPLAWLLMNALTLSAPRPAQKQKLSNKEEWVWVDYKGRERRIVVHREVE